MNDTMLTGSLMDEIENMTLDELAGICSCKTEWIIELVNEGILEPRGQSQTEWRFSGNCLLRTRTAYRLYQDLQINVAGIALVIDLVDEVNALQARLRVFETQ